MKEGQQFVYSEALGCVQDYRQRIQTSAASRSFPAVTRILNKWLRDRLQATGIEDDWHWSSIAVNRGFPAKAHRDEGNLGPSLAKAFGGAGVGGLRY